MNTYDNLGKAKKYIELPDPSDGASNWDNGVKQIRADAMHEAVIVTLDVPRQGRLDHISLRHRELEAQLIKLMTESGITVSKIYVLTETKGRVMVHHPGKLPPTEGECINLAPYIQ
jgi:hypothetical protein